MFSMPIRPPLICRQCERRFPNPKQRGPRPLYCSERCKAIYNIDNKERGRHCARCDKPLPANVHFSQRYCSSCKFGCRVCGKEVTKGSKRLKPLYCSIECQNEAWSNVPIPTCPGWTDTTKKSHICEVEQKTGKPKKLDLPRPPKALRDPPVLCLKCWQAQRKNHIGEKAFNEERKPNVATLTARRAESERKKKIAADKKAAAK